MFTFKIPGCIIFTFPFHLSNYSFTLKSQCTTLPNIEIPWFIAQNLSPSLPCLNKFLSEGVWPSFPIPWSLHNLMKSLKPLNKLPLHLEFIKCWLIHRQVLQSWEECISVSEESVVPLDLHGFQKRQRQHPFPSSLLSHHLCVYSWKLHIMWWRKTNWNLKVYFMDSEIILVFSILPCLFLCKTIIFSFTCLLFSTGSKLHVSPESLILFVQFKDICRQL